MIGVRRSIEVSGMAAKAIGTGALEVAADVARRALHRTVSSTQGKTGVRIVVKTSPAPLCEVMACLAGSGKPSTSMVDRASALIILGVARDTGCAESCKHTACCPAVARFTRGHAVGADQGESIGVMLHCIDLHSPTFNRMAVLARCAELSAMEVGMAGRTGLADIREDGLHMTTFATDG